MKHYQNLHQSPFSPDVWLYTRTDVSQPVWYCRIKLDGHKGHLVRSTRTTDLTEASSIARQLWLGEIRALAVGTTSTMSFSRLCDEFLEQFRASSSRTIAVSRSLSLMRREFGKTQIHNITADTFYKFLQRPNRPKARLSLATLLSYRQNLVQVLTYARRKNYIEEVPHISTSFHKHTPEIIKTERATAKGLSKHWTGRWRSFLAHITEPTRLSQRHHRSRFPVMRLKYIYYFCWWSLVRPTRELTGIKWRDLTPADYHGQLFYVVYVRDAKDSKGTGTKTRTAVLPIEGSKWLVEWRDYCIELGLYHEDNWVFPGQWTAAAKACGDKPPRLEMSTVGPLFSRLLSEMADWRTAKYPDGMRLPYSTGMNATHDERNRRITFYSAARSSALTHQIRSGRPLAEISELAGTSIQMLENNYRAEINHASASRWANTQESRPYWKRYKPETVPYAERDSWTRNKAEEAILPHEPIEPTIQENATNTDPDPEEDWEAFLKANY